MPGFRYGKVKDFKLVRRGDERSALIEYINLDDAIRWYSSTLQYPLNVPLDAPWYILAWAT